MAIKQLKDLLIKQYLEAQQQGFSYLILVYNDRGHLFWPIPDGGKILRDKIIELAHCARGYVVYAELIVIDLSIALEKQVSLDILRQSPITSEYKKYFNLFRGREIDNSITESKIDASV